MKLKFNTNLLKVNIFIVLIFNLYLLGLVYGPSLVNLFIFALLIIFLKNFKQNNLFSIRNYDLITKLQIIFCIYLILNSYFVGDEINLFYKSLFFFRFFLIAFVISRILEFKHKTLDYIAICFLLFSVFLSIDIFINTIQDVIFLVLYQEYVYILMVYKTLIPKIVKDFQDFWIRISCRKFFINLWNIFTFYFHFKIYQSKIYSNYFFNMFYNNCNCSYFIW